MSRTVIVDEIDYINKILKRTSNFTVDYFSSKEYFEKLGYKVIHPRSEEDQIVAFFNTGLKKNLLKATDCKDLYTVYKVKEGTSEEIVFAAQYFTVEINRHLVSFVFRIKTEQSMQKKYLAETFFNDLKDFIKPTLKLAYFSGTIVAGVEKSKPQQTYFQSLGFNNSMCPAHLASLQWFDRIPMYFSFVMPGEAIQSSMASGRPSSSIKVVNSKNVWQSEVAHKVTKKRTAKAAAKKDFIQIESEDDEDNKESLYSQQIDDLQRLFMQERRKKQQQQQEEDNQLHLQSSPAQMQIGIQNVPVQSNTEDQEEENTSETQSAVGGGNVARSTVSRAAKAQSGANHKHCNMGDCGGKFISGGNWSRHINEQHDGIANEVLFTPCAGLSCESCAKGPVVKSNGKSVYICKVCGTAKRVDSFPKEDKTTCKVCTNKGASKSVVVFGNTTLNQQYLKQFQPEDPKEMMIRPTDSISNVGSKRTHPGEDDLESYHQEEHGEFQAPGPLIKRQKTTSNTVISQQQQQQQHQQQQQLHGNDLLNQLEANDGNDDIYMLDESGQQQDDHSNTVSHQLTNLDQVSVDSNNTATASYLLALTDTQALTKLKEIEASNKSKFILEQDLLKICEQFTQDLFVEYISRGEHSVIAELIPRLLARPDQLNGQRTLGICIFSFILGGACWNSCGKLINDMEKDKRSQFLTELCLHIAKRFGNIVSDWSCKHYRYIEDQHFKLISYLRDNKKDIDERLLMISFAVQLSDFEDFVYFTELFLIVPAAELMVSCMMERPKQQKISVDSYLELASLIQEHTAYTTILENKDEFIETPLGEWKALIDMHQAQGIANASSAQEFIDELVEKYGEINEDLNKDLTKNEDCMLGMVVHNIQNPPNNKQFALAQYCIGKLYKDPRQLWVVPSGQGKSRIAATAAAVALTTGVSTKVHIVFENEHLKKRDMADFEDLWMLLQFESEVQYYVGCNFTPAKDELVIIDEADIFMLNETESFIKLVNECACLCFTATPDNGDEKGPEARIINALGFRKYQYIIEPEAKPATVASALVVDEDVQAVTIEDKAAYIKEQLAMGPVLVFCGSDLTEEIKKLGCDCLEVTEDIDPALLRSLHLAPYKVIIVQGEFGMRGIDYRCPEVRMTLVIAKSFINKREAMQGFSRVGRFGDEAKRVKFTSIQIVDKAAELRYTSKLFQCMMKLLKKPIALKKVQVESMTKGYTNRQKQLLSIKKIKTTKPAPTVPTSMNGEQRQQRQQ